MRFVAFLLTLACSACSGGRGNPTGPTPTGSGPGEWHRLVDGAGNPGSVTFRWTRLTIESTIAASFVARFCYGLGEPEAVTPVPNPTNGPHLASVRIALVTSADGIQEEERTNYAAHEGADKPFVVPNGQCVNIRRIPEREGGTPGIQFLGLQPRSTHVLVKVQYGPYEWGYLPVTRGTVSEQPCPPLEEIGQFRGIGTSRPPCVLRWFTPLQQGALQTRLRLTPYMPARSLVTGHWRRAQSQEQST